MLSKGEIARRLRLGGAIVRDVHKVMQIITLPKTS